jgi:hypothetical protein
MIKTVKYLGLAGRVVGEHSNGSQETFPTEAGFVFRADPPFYGERMLLIMPNTKWETEDYLMVPAHSFSGGVALIREVAIDLVQWRKTLGPSNLEQLFAVHGYSLDPDTAIEAKHDFKTYMPDPRMPEVAQLVTVKEGVFVYKLDEPLRGSEHYVIQQRADKMWTAFTFPEGVARPRELSSIVAAAPGALVAQSKKAMLHKLGLLEQLPFSTLFKQPEARA